MGYQTGDDGYQTGYDVVPGRGRVTTLMNHRSEILHSLIFHVVTKMAILKGLIILVFFVVIQLKLEYWLEFLR